MFLGQFPKLVFFEDKTKVVLNLRSEVDANFQKNGKHIQAT